MKKHELVAEIAKKSGLTQVDSVKVIDVLGEVIYETCIEKGDEINIPGLGKFKQKINQARKGINPLTQKPMDVKESHTIKFQAASSLKKVIEPTPKGKKK